MTFKAFWANNKDSTTFLPILLRWKIRKKTVNKVADKAVNNSADMPADFTKLN